MESFIFETVLFLMVLFLLYCVYMIFFLVSVRRERKRFKEKQDRELEVLNKQKEATSQADYLERERKMQQAYFNWRFAENNRMRLIEHIKERNRFNYIRRGKRR